MLHKERKEISVKRNKTAEKEMEELSIEVLPPSSFFEEMPNPMPPIQPAPFGEEEIEEPPLEDFELEVAEEGLAEEREELEVDQKLLERDSFSSPGHYVGIPEGSRKDFTSYAGERG